MFDQKSVGSPVHLYIGGQVSFEEILGLLIRNIFEKTVAP